MYDLYSKFDIEKHKQTYIHYFEVVLFSDGHIEYAVPSHQEKLIAICCAQLNVSREELFAMCPLDYYFNVITWMCNISGCISLWEDYMMKSDCNDITDAQRQTLLTLIDNGLYRGEI